MLNIGIVGLGLTGAAIARYILEQRDDIRIVMAGAGPQSAKAGKDLGSVLGIAPCGVTIVAAEEIPHAMTETNPQAVIDFSHPDHTIDLLRQYARARCSVVVGTTGFSSTQFEQMKRAAGTQRLGILYAPNITRGVNVLQMIARLAVQCLPGYDIEVIERHHRNKKDAPSGTARKIAEQLHETAGTNDTIYGRSGQTGKRPEGEIAVHAVRAGGIVGVHEVLLAGEFDEIVITHRSESRLAFAAGAADAATWIAQRRGFFTMEDMLMQREFIELLTAEHADLDEACAEEAVDSIPT